MLSAWLLAGAGLFLSGHTGRRDGAHARHTGRFEPSPLVVATVVGVAAGVAVAYRFGLSLGVAATIACATGAHTVASSRRRRDATVRRRSLAAAVRLMAAELEAGARPAEALRAGASVCAAHASEFSAAALAAEAGADAVTAFDAAELEPIAQAWHVAMSTGAPAADVLTRVADDLDARAEQERQIAAVTAGPRASAALLAVLPAFGLLLGTAMGARPLPLLVDGSGGRALLAAGLTLDAIGVVWTQRLVSRAALP